MSNILSESFDKLRKVKQDLVLSNQKLALEAVSDPLTKLNNRRFFNLEIKRLWSIAKRCDFPICVITIDIDYFKLFNDHYGHLEGDKAIVAVADCIKKAFKRGEDNVARYGGEEFICVTLNKTKSEISERAQELMIKLSEKKINHVKSQVSEYLTVSIGSATSKGKETETNDLVALADQGLYEAKQRGRNCHVHISIPLDLFKRKKDNTH